MACSPGIHGRSTCHSLAICLTAIPCLLSALQTFFESHRFGIFVQQLRVSRCRLAWQTAQCPNLKSITNVELTSGKIDCMDTLTVMTKLTKLHFVSFQVGNYNFACLRMLPNLRDLSIDIWFLDDAFRLGNFVQNVEQPRLNLRRLDISGFGVFGSLCYSERIRLLAYQYVTILPFNTTT